jgi:hypothetical protein
MHMSLNPDNLAIYLRLFRFVLEQLSVATDDWQKTAAPTLMSFQWQIVILKYFSLH